MTEEKGKETTADHKLLDEVTTDEEAKERTWRDALPEISEIFEACLQESYRLLGEFAEGCPDYAPRKFVSIDTTVRLAESIFSAVVTAEAGRRHAELQKQMGQHISIPILGEQGEQRFKIQIPHPGGTGG